MSKKYKTIWDKTLTKKVGHNCRKLPKRKITKSICRCLEVCTPNAPKFQSYFVFSSHIFLQYFLVDAFQLSSKNSNILQIESKMAWYV